jgi:exodeoxyribonuclease VII small subunit
MARAKKKAAGFEEMMAQLEEHLSQMESGRLTLDEMVEQYAAGIKIAAACRDYLADVELRLQQMAEPVGTVEKEKEHE